MYMYYIHTYIFFKAAVGEDLYLKLDFTGE